MLLLVNGDWIMLSTFTESEHGLYPLFISLSWLNYAVLKLKTDLYSQFCVLSVYVYNYVRMDSLIRVYQSMNQSINQPIEYYHCEARTLWVDHNALINVAIVLRAAGCGRRGMYDRRTIRAYTTRLAQARPNYAYNAHARAYAYHMLVLSICTFLWYVPAASICCLHLLARSS